MSSLASSVRRRLAGASLRARLLLGLVVVAALGLVVADVVVYSQIRSYLAAQIDQQLHIAAPRIASSVAFGEPVDLSHLPVGTYVATLSQSGQVVASSNPSAAKLTVPAAALARAGPPGIFAETDSQIFTAFAGGAAYRAVVFLAPARLAFAYPGSAFVLVAIPLSSINGTLGRLVDVDLAVSAAVLAALAALGYLVVRVGMRPLAEIERTAAAIEAGDLSRRVPHDDARTEVGRLGRTFNAMLGRLEHAFAEQQASERRLRQFLADASHELRTPVTSIRGYAELFRRGAASRPEDLGRAMRRIEEEAARMGGLVDDLLLLARLDQGRPLERTPVDLGLVATDAAADAQVLEPARPVTVSVDGLVVVEGDEQRLRQLVGNLLQNALRHTPAGTPVEVRVERADGRAVLVVADEGPGMAPEDAARAFERFYRADRSRARDSGGAGLGLAIVASIAEAHGGSARLDTAPGRGTRVVVELPLLVPASGAPARPAPAAPPTR